MKSLSESLIEPLNEALFSKNNLENNKVNKYGISKKDMIGELNGFPVGVVVRMMEEQELQGNKPDVKVFQDEITADKSDGGFTWNKTEGDFDLWSEVSDGKFNIFFEKYPEYKIYN